MKELTGKFYDIQGFSVHDGPGIRLTLFMKGCPCAVRVPQPGINSLCHGD